jgi:hypothetical protein
LPYFISYHMSFSFPHFSVFSQYSRSYIVYIFHFSCFSLFLDIFQVQGVSV